MLLLLLFKSLNVIECNLLNVIECLKPEQCIVRYKVIIKLKGEVDDGKVLKPYRDWHSV